MPPELIKVIHDAIRQINNGKLRIPTRHISSVKRYKDWISMYSKLSSKSLHRKTYIKSAGPAPAIFVLVIKILLSTFGIQR